MALKRELQLWEVTLAGVGVIVGAGIYALLGKGAAIVGESVWLSFAIGGLIALMTSLSYAELSARYPKAGAEYVYTKHTLGKTLARLCGFALLLVGMTSATTVALGFGGYLFSLTSIPVLIGAVAIILISALILTRGAHVGASLASSISVVEILGLLVVIFLGLPTLANGFAIPDLSALPTVLYGTAVVFFAFLGFEELVRMSEEMKDAKRRMPIALLAAVALASVLYVLVSASAIGLVGAEELGRSAAPLASVVKPHLGETGFFLMSIAGLLSTFNTVLLIILATSRLLYGMAIEKTIPRIFSRTMHNQPLPALAMAAAGSLVLLGVGTITLLAQVTDALLFGVFALMNFVVLRLHQQNKPFDGFRVPLRVGKIPVPAALGMVASLGMLFFVEVNALFYALLFLLGIIVLLHFVRRKE